LAKAPDAFRTISEVSDALNTPAHVLRFWESKFSQIKPVKRAGGRRYYRPDDIALLAGIKHLLHEQGMTIKGAQKLLRENGAKHVAGLVGSPIQQEHDTVSVDPKREAVPVSAPVEQALSDDPNGLEATSQTKPLDVSQFVPADPPQEVTARWFDSALNIDAQKIRANSASIVPLIAKLETVRGRIRAS